MKYYDPRNDIAFRKVFGEHKRLCISFINALLPLEEPVKSIEYLTPDMLPESPGHKNSSVDVRCRDTKGRSFIVEMQMYWTESFLSRTLLNACKAYTAQTKRGQNFGELQPVYALCLLNDIYLDGEKYAEEYKHVYYIQHENHPELRVDGMSFVFIELPKFQSSNRVYNKMTDLWLSFLTDVEGKMSRNELPEALTSNEDISMAIDCLEESSFTREERLAYDIYWDAVSREVTIVSDGEKRGIKQGIEIGKAEGHAEGLAEGHAKGLAEGHSKGVTEGYNEAINKTARKLKLRGVPIETIADTTGLSAEEINAL